MVTRALFVMVGALLAVALAFGVFVRWSPASTAGIEVEGRAADTARGETLYATHCGTCHTLDFSVEYLRAAPSLDAGAAALAEFLRNHGSASETEAAVIVAHVKAHAAYQSETPRTVNHATAMLNTMFPAPNGKMTRQ